MAKHDYVGLTPRFSSYPLEGEEARENLINDIMRYMFNRTEELFAWDGLSNQLEYTSPDEIVQITPRYIEMLLQINGMACIFENDGKLYASRGGLGGEPNASYQPTICTVSVPALNYSAMLGINENCVIIRNDDMYAGLTPMFRKYATMLADAEISMRVFDINSRIPSIFITNSDKSKAEWDRYLKRVKGGDLAIMLDKAIAEGTRTAPYAGQNSRLTANIEYRQYLWASWLNELGLQSNWNMKREALSDSEVSVNDLALLPLIDNMLKCRKEGAEAVNKMFGTNWTVELSSAWKLTREDVEADIEAQEAETGPKETETDPEEKEDETDDSK